MSFLLLGLVVAILAGGHCPPPEPSPHILFHLALKKPLVALTFDDGPSPTNTPIILRILRAHQAHATFFVVGKEGERHGALLRAIVRSGNEVASHSYSHARLSRMDSVKLETELNHAVVSVQRFTGIPPRFLRPPYGRWSTRLLEAARHHGLTLVLWNRDSRDWAHPGQGRVVENALQKLSPGDILLFHDGGGDRIQTRAALPEVLARLHAKGYQAVSVGELVREGQEEGVPLPVGLAAEKG